MLSLIQQIKGARSINPHNKGNTKECDFIGVWDHTNLTRLKQEDLMDITWGLVAVSLIGTILNAMQKNVCWYFWIVANVGWCFYNAAMEMYPQAILFGVYIVTSLFGLFNWIRIKKKCNMPS